MILINLRTNKPPYHRALLNPAHRLNSGMVCCLLYNEPFSAMSSANPANGMLWWDLVNPNHVFTIPSAAIGPCRPANEGYGLQIGSAQGTRHASTQDYIANADAVTIVVRFIDEDTNTGRGFFIRGQAADWSVGIGRSTNDPKYRMSVVTTVPGTSQSDSPNTATLTKGLVHTIMGVWNPSTELRIFYDGIDGGATATAGKTTLRNNASGIYIPGNASGFAAYGQYLMTCIYNRVLSADEARELHEFPYGTNQSPRFILREPDLFFGVGSPPVGPTGAVAGSMNPFFGF